MSRYQGPLILQCDVCATRTQSNAVERTNWTQLCWGWFSSYETTDINKTENTHDYCPACTEKVKHHLRLGGLK